MATLISVVSDKVKAVGPGVAAVGAAGGATVAGLYQVLGANRANDLQ